MLRVIWQDRAEQDLKRLYQFIVDINPVPAERMASEILESVYHLRRLPEMGRLIDNKINSRELIIPFGARAYVISYKIEANAVVILRIWHSNESRG